MFRSSFWKGLASGLAGGLAASWVMNRYQDLWDGGGGGGESAPAKVAEKLSETLLRRPLDGERKAAAATAVHYAFGVLTGGVYGAAAEEFPLVRAGMGLPYGAMVWLQADELALPALGLSGPVTQYSWKIHAYALSSHLVYGGALEGVRRLVRAWL